VTAPLRVAVVGVGGFGRHHARIYKELEPEGVRLVGLVDLDPERPKELAARLGVPVATTLEGLPERCDAVTVAVPARAHRQVAEPLLARGVHCLVEKPIATNVADAEALLAAARRGGAVLQVGHVERFNPVMAAVERLGIRPVFVEVHRLSPFSFRSADVGVVEDLMIHDLDIVLHLTGEEPTGVEAVGVPVIGEREDIANARLTFPGGAVANVTASRVSLTKMRKIRIFSSDAYVSLDYDRREAVLVRKSPLLTRAEMERRAGGGADLSALAGVDFGDLLTVETLPIEDADPLTEELRSFVGAVRSGSPPRVGGLEGMKALAVAERILVDLSARPVPGRPPTRARAGRPGT
jgi:predicted dehydrogenase